MSTLNTYQVIIWYVLTNSVRFDMSLKIRKNTGYNLKLLEFAQLIFGKLVGKDGRKSGIFYRNVSVMQTFGSFWSKKFGVTGQHSTEK